MKRNRLILGLLLLLLSVSGCGDGTSPDANGGQDSTSSESKDAAAGGAGPADDDADVEEGTQQNPKIFVDVDANAEGIADWVFTTDSALTFDESGLVKNLILGDVDFFSNGTPSGFYLVHTDGDTETETHLSQISTSGDDVVVSLPDGSVSFTIRIEGWGNHVALHLLSMNGIGTDHSEGLRLYLRSNASVSHYTLNDVMTASARSNNTRLTLNWPYLWAPARPNGTHGSAVIYDGTKVDGELDELLAEVWAVQGTLGHMVHPAGQERWTRAVVTNHVEQWVEKFDTMAVVSLAPKNKEELYQMTEDWVFPASANRVYLFSSFWRGEYHLYDLRNESVAGDAFPNGKEDLLAYSEYLAERGAHLQLKSLVPHLPRKDPEYFSDTHCEDRFLSWGSGTLVSAIDTEATTILFKPGPDYIWEKEDGFVRIGHEMVYAKAITIDRGSGIWTLSDCERGYINTSPHAHSAGAEMQGVVHSYSYFHHADDFGQPNSLAEEILNPYGDFLSEVNVGHLHFDGTGNKAEAPWYLRSYTDYVYSRVDQPVTGSRVGGSIPAIFERKFPMAARAAQATDYWGIRIGPRLDGMGSGADAAERDHAPSLLDMHFDISDRVVIGGRRPNFTGGRSGGILTNDILEGYGLIDEAYALYKNWIELAPIYDDIDVEYLAGFLTKSGNHYRGEDSLVLSKNDSGEYIYTPHRIMGRSSGADPMMTIDQEWGAKPRFQYISAGTRLTLTNPYPAQEPQVVIRVEPDSSVALNNPLVTVTGSGTLSVTGNVEPGEYMKFEGGNEVNVYDPSWNFLRTLPAATTNFTVSGGNNEVTTAAGSGTAKPELRVQFITLGPVYVLESNKHL